MAKGLSNRRAEALAAKVKRWDGYQENSWLGEVEPPVDYGRPVRVFVKRRLKEEKYLHSYYVSTLTLPRKAPFWSCMMPVAGQKWSNFAMTRAV